MITAWLACLVLVTLSGGEISPMQIAPSLPVPRPIGDAHTGAWAIAPLIGSAWIGEREENRATPDWPKHYELRFERIIPDQGIRIVRSGKDSNYFSETLVTFAYDKNRLISFSISNDDSYGNGLVGVSGAGAFIIEQQTPAGRNFDGVRDSYVLENDELTITTEVQIHGRWMNHETVVYRRAVEP